MTNTATTSSKTQPAEKTQAKAAQRKRRAKRELTSDAIKKLELEYFKKRRELEKQERKALRETRAKDVAEGKKLVTMLRKRYSMTDEQIVKRLGLSSNARGS